MPWKRRSLFILYFKNPEKLSTSRVQKQKQKQKQKVVCGGKKEKKLKKKKTSPTPTPILLWYIFKNRYALNDNPSLISSH